MKIYLPSRSIQMSMSKGSVLFLTTQLPFPPKSGGTVKSWNYVKDLANRYQLTVACLLKDDDEKHLHDFQQKLSLKSVITENHQTARSAKTLLNSYMGFPCLNVYRNFSKTFKAKLDQEWSQHQVVIVDHYEMFQYVPDSYQGKVVLHTHNAEFMLWQRMSELENNPLKKYLLKNEAKRVAKYEQEIFNRSDLVYTTDSDRELYLKHSFTLGNFKTTYHLGNDDLLALADLRFSETELALTFMGTLSWEPNIDGLLWFVNEVWPKLKVHFPELKLYVLGKNPDNRIKNACEADTNIIFTGFVENLDSYLKRTRVYLAPLRFGSGMKVKVLEGLYRGVPTVSTSVGAEGILVKDQQHIMIADKPDEFAQKCETLLKDESKWNLLRDESRKLAAKNYRWQPLFNRMDKALQELF